MSHDVSEAGRHIPRVSPPAKDRAPEAGRHSRRHQASFEGWSIFDDDYEFLVKFCCNNSIHHVAEFGPGDSTLAFLDACCEIVSYESDADWLARARERFRDEGSVEIIHCPEGHVPEPDPSRITPQLVFVDGPPGYGKAGLPRLQPCMWALDSCGLLILHDAERDGEQAVLLELERLGAEVIMVPTAKGIAIVFDPKRIDLARLHFPHEDGYSLAVELEEHRETIRCAPVDPVRIRKPE